MKRGFTLVELAIVVVIAGILAAVAIPIYQGLVEESKWSEGKTAAGSIRQALDVYKAKNSGKLPGLTATTVLAEGSIYKYDVASLSNFKYFNSGDFTISAIDTNAGTYTILVTGSKVGGAVGTYSLGHNGAEAGP